MTKAALDNMVNWMSKELRKEGIRINGIAPGLIKTNLTKSLWNHPLANKGMGLPSEIASVVATICSKVDGRFMNGEIYHLNGGYVKM